MADLRARIPDFNLPIFNPQTGMMNPVWFQFFLKLFDRTGGSSGEPPDLDVIISTQSLLNSAVQIQADAAGFQDIVAQLQSVPLLPRMAQFYLGDVAAHGVQVDELLHALVTTTAHGFMSAADKVKLNGITGGAAVASVSGTAPIASSGGTTPVISISAATTSAAGSMSAADKTKLDSITGGAAVASVSGTAPIVSSGGTTPAISINPATISGAGSLSASDKIKLDSLINGLSASLTASVTTTNTTADTSILSLVVPAATFVVGSVLEARLMADISGAAAGGNLSIWIKVGATKLHTLTVSLPAGATSGIGLRLNMLMTQRSGTTMQLSGELVTAQNTLLPVEVITTVLNGFDASISNTVILGWNWSAANAANIAIAHTALMKQEK